MPRAHPPQRWSKEAKKLVVTVRGAGGGVLPADNGKLQVFGPGGIAVVDEPGEDPEPVMIEIAVQTGLKIGK